MTTIENFRGRMLAPSAVAEALGNSEATVHRWIKAGKVAAVRLGYRMTRVDGDSLANFLQGAKIEPGTAAPLPASLVKANEARRRAA